MTENWDHSSFREVHRGDSNAEEIHVIEIDQLIKLEEILIHVMTIEVLDEVTFHKIKPKVPLNTMNLEIDITRGAVSNVVHYI